MDKNLPMIAAIMALSIHVASDIGPLSNEDSLLVPSPNHFLPCSNMMNREGVIFYYDSNRFTWIRADLAIGEELTNRLEKHKSTVSLPKPQENFHIRYPAKDCLGSTFEHRKGHFENIQSYMAIYYDPSNT